MCTSTRTSGLIHRSLDPQSPSRHQAPQSSGKLPNMGQRPAKSRKTERPHSEQAVNLHKRAAAEH
eukprot:1458822-Alexandrium_andersonii.AAC.1